MVVAIEFIELLSLNYHGIYNIGLYKLGTHIILNMFVQPTLKVTACPYHVNLRNTNIHENYLKIDYIFKGKVCPLLNSFDFNPKLMIIVTLHKLCFKDCNEPSETREGTLRMGLINYLLVVPVK
jgi:hypothetical protein